MNKNVSGYLSDAIAFIENEKPFHLGFLPTEQSSPLTRGLDRVMKADTAAGVRMLQRVDRNVLAMAEKVLAGATFQELVTAGTTAVLSGHKIVFSGCGATGRLSILLESMWRRFFVDLQADHEGVSDWASPLGNSVFSIMTGGDYALIRAVEFFEDYAEFGRQQVRELDLVPGDVLVAITEGGETSSVLGTVDEAVRRGAQAFLLFNNPAALLRDHLERSRVAIDNPGVKVLDLSCGPMALAGSTRMQATTSEQWIAGAALEQILVAVMQQTGRKDYLSGYRQGIDYAADFAVLLKQLESEPAVAALSGYIEFEADLYREKGLVTYFADDFLLDIFTDTTERSPTFMLPPFRKCDDSHSVSSWAFVKNPSFPTVETWKRCLARSPRCLNWKPDDYRRMGAGDAIIANPPGIQQDELQKFVIGSEINAARYGTAVNAAVLIGVGTAPDELEFRRFEQDFAIHAGAYRKAVRLFIGPTTRRDGFVVPCLGHSVSPLRLMEHMAVKLVLNTVSTGTMVKLGRVESNWMSWVDVSNKKLIDRGIRLIAELTGNDYRHACIELFRSIEELRCFPPGKEKPSPVQHTICRLRGERNTIH